MDGQEQRGDFSCSELSVLDVEEGPVDSSDAFGELELLDCWMVQGKKTHQTTEHNHATTLQSKQLTYDVQTDTEKKRDEGFFLFAESEH